MHRIAAALAAFAGCVACTGCTGVSQSFPPLAAVGPAQPNQTAAIQPATSRWNTGAAPSIFAQSGTPALAPMKIGSAAMPLENVAYRPLPVANASTAAPLPRVVQPMAPLVPVTRRRKPNMQSRSLGSSSAIRGAPVQPAPSTEESRPAAQPALSMGGFPPVVGPAMSLPPGEAPTGGHEIRRLPPVEHSRQPALVSPPRGLPQPPIPLYPATGLN